MPIREETTSSLITMPRYVYGGSPWTEGDNPRILITIPGSNLDLTMSLRLNLNAGCLSIMLNSSSGVRANIA